MNVEYMKLSDETTAVTNENGIINKRDEDVSSNELLIENKIETVDNAINQIKKKLIDWKGVVFTSKRMLIYQPILLVVFPLLGYAFGGLNGAINLLANTLILFIPATIYWGIVLPISKKKLKGYECKLEKAEELKTEYKKELEKEKKIVTKKENTINKPISLVEQNNTELPLIGEQLENTHFNAMPSNDSEVIANKLDGFSYDQSKKSEVLSKYNGMNENNESVRTLKRTNI